MKAFIIDCSTGCSCCSGDNHYRGFYEDKETAERRISYFLSPESKYWPVASQFARRGRYGVREVDVELISDNRYILFDEVIHGEPVFISVSSDGTIVCDDVERLPICSY